MNVLQRYGETLRPPGAAAALGASLIGRLSLGMNGLALLLLVRATTGSYASAGLVSAAYAVSLGIVAPSRARRADRRGPVGVLRFCGLLHPVALGALVLLAHAKAPTWLLALAAVGVGATVAPLGAVMRALWAELLTGAQLATAYSLESVVVELCFVGGPVLVAALAVLDPTYPALASALVASLGAMLLAANPAVRDTSPHPERVHSLAGPLVSPAVRALLLTWLFVGASFGSIEVGVLAFVDEQGSRRAVAGVVLAIWSVGSIVGGLAYGARQSTRPHERQVTWLAGFLAVSACLPLLATSTVGLSLLLLVAGSAIAPYAACCSVLMGQAAPRGTTTEAFAWTSSMIFAGGALGTAVAGVLVEGYGARWAFVLTAATGGLLAVTTLAGRAALRAPEAPDGSLTVV